MLSIIVAIANNNVIGKDNKLLCYLPDDLKRFKEITSNKTIIMGRKTFESIGRVLPNRKHIIISRQGMDIDNDNVEVINDISLLDKYINSDEENFVIGGGTIYSLLMPYVNKLYITKIDEDFDGDTFFPPIKTNEWEIIEEKQGLKNEENPYNYRYITYVRKNN